MTLAKREPVRDDAGDVIAWDVEVDGLVLTLPVATDADEREAEDDAAQSSLFDALDGGAAVEGGHLARAEALLYPGLRYPELTRAQRIAAQRLAVSWSKAADPEVWTDGRKHRRAA